MCSPSSPSCEPAMAAQLGDFSPNCSDMVLVFGEAGGESEMPVHSVLLRLASPVFEAMLSTDMAEKESRRVRVEAASFEDFAEFYKFLLPLRGRTMKLSESNVDSMLAISDYYQVEPLKEECAAVLEGLPVSVPRLLQAHRHGLRRQYERCAEAIGQCFHKHDLTLLSRHTDILMDVVLRSQLCYAAMQDRLTKICALRSEVLKARDRARQHSVWQASQHIEDPWQERRGHEDPWAQGADPWAQQTGPIAMDSLLALMCESPEGLLKPVPPPPPIPYNVNV